MSRGVNLSKSQFVMIFVVKNIHQISVKRMNVVELWEFLNNLAQTIVKALLGEFYFASVESTNSRDFIILVNYGRSFALSF